MSLLNHQQAFDKMLAHVRQQGRPSMNGTACLYRGPGGRMCAVGCLIPDNCYDMNLEGMPASNGAVLDALVGTVLEASLPWRNFLEDAQQSLHDRPFRHAGVSASAFLSLVEKSAQSFAAQFNLTYTPPA